MNRRVAALIAIMGGSGVLHFAKPGFYETIVPPALGDARRMVLASGAAELVCAAMLATPTTRRLGGWVGVGILVGVFPANLYSVKVVGPSKAAKAAAIARLPMQWPMVSAALKVAREA